ncbi:50S ribosomal protein L11 methyltransferase [Compostibacter hankyongensis]|uniref:Ribosomal protein L11 methyltransferase n=1 Tax=Compostibacter hankyongensis TaxID=1007089 RepID=A0ABP8G9R8_9BACT
MENYVSVIITCPPGQQRDILIGWLDDLGYEGFEEREEELVASLPEPRFDPKALEELLLPLGLRHRRELQQPVNWNARWEASFSPVRIGDFCGIRAAFHPPVEDVLHEIIITPRMTFGTGHHATTSAMIRLMQKLDFSGKKVLDFGTGTAILALLAERCGAAAVCAVDNDGWAVRNARENLTENNSRNIMVEEADRVPPGAGSWDIVLANLNRHILVEQLPALEAALSPGGSLLVSGILEADGALMTATAARYGLAPAEQLLCDGWLALRFGKS